MRWTVTSMGGDSYGTLVTDDRGFIKKHESEPVDKGLFEHEIGESIANVMQRYWRMRFAAEEASVEKTLAASGEIVKADKAQQNVFGWAYVTHDKDGKVVVDKSGDFIDQAEEIEKSAYDFVLRSRQGDADHTNVKGSTMIESVVFTPEKVAKMGIPEGVVPTGWWVGFHVEDAATWARVEKGELTAFSIHGKGTRKAVE